MIIFKLTQVVSCQSGVRKENDVLLDYLEFRNSLQQVACWKLQEFEPTLEGGAFGRRLQVLRSNPQQLSNYLSHLIRFVIKKDFLKFTVLYDLQEFIMDIAQP